MTTTKLPRRLTCRLQTDAPKNHMQSDHNMALTRNMLVNNTVQKSWNLLLTKEDWKSHISKNIHLKYTAQNNDVASMPTLRPRSRRTLPNNDDVFAEVSPSTDNTRVLPNTLSNV